MAQISVETLLSAIAAWGFVGVLSKTVASNEIGISMLFFRSITIDVSLFLFAFMQKFSSIYVMRKNTLNIERGIFTIK